MDERSARRPFAARFHEWRRERGSWTLCEQLRSHARELDSLIEAREASAPTSAEHAKLLQSARGELRRAESVIDFGTHRRSPRASHVTAAQLHINSALSLWLRTLPAKELEPCLPGIFAAVRLHLSAEDERRTAVERIALEVRAAQEASRDVALAPDRLMTIVEALKAAWDAELREKLRAQSFARLVRWTTVFLAGLAIAVAVVSMVWPRVVPLCFNPPAAPALRGGVAAVCPTASREQIPDVGKARATADTAGRADYLAVEFIGLTAASVAAAAALRKVRGTSTAFGIPVALALLKLPTGALTAVLGLLLMRGGFIPGLSALDSAGQIIAWAVVFGYSQELFTKFVDRQGQAVLADVRGPAEPPRAAVVHKPARA
ncbi:hypothetical protein F8568_046285 [Actinomadura sp. LD22]|uniref:Uncharacterized protein n=1 Tax=Actinomadura physcomitrii TaxID=2650748 RepID=A0A6I4MYA0_9ACTN|nr:hypothetical protein [Actinomadura physcomitrii]MWA07599.1 hypothetical protein [Actinomadura physcomitrii]